MVVQVDGQGRRSSVVMSNRQVVKAVDIENSLGTSQIKTTSSQFTNT